MKKLVQTFMGEQEAAKRNVPTADSVSQNEEGLRQLIVSELLIFLSVSCESMFFLFHIFTVR